MNTQFTVQYQWSVLSKRHASGIRWAQQLIFRNRCVHTNTTGAIASDEKGGREIEGDWGMRAFEWVWREEREGEML